MTVGDLSILRCPEHDVRVPLQMDVQENKLVCAEGHEYPIINDIPRFVERNNYAVSFGLQWNAYRTAQLDSYTGVPISRERLRRLAGGDLDLFQGKTVLEAGCGAGRFTEILLEAGASVFAVDLSNAVEANKDNCGYYDHYYICQADILRLPVEPEHFDVVVCIGVVQHTPDPRATVAALCTHVKPGGLLIMDHYASGNALTLSRRLLRKLFLTMPPSISLLLVRLLTSVLWPVHRFMWVSRSLPGLWRVVRWLRPRFLRLSPILDYHDTYPQLGSRNLRLWAELDTHDTLTDAYKHMRTTDQISSYLRWSGMVGIDSNYAGNGVEARARKPTVGEQPRGFTAEFP